MATATKQSESDLDLFSPDVVQDPFPVLDRLREQSPAVYMTKYGFWLLTRYDEIRGAAADWETFSSAQGVALMQPIVDRMAGAVLTTDPPEHDQLRAVLSDKLAPRGLAQVRERISSYASSLVAEVIAKGTFDGVIDIARVFPINAVADLVGLPVEGRELMHPGADATFSAFGPFTEYTMERASRSQEYNQWMGTMADRAKLTPGGWGEVVMDAVDDGRLTQLGAIRTMSAYLTAGMDTTVNAIGSLMKLFVERPEIYQALRANPKLAAPIFEEILRVESPVSGFFRVATKDVTIGDQTIRQGEKVFLHWTSGNRDPRHYANPDVFDIDRNPLDHLAFGYGVHACAGQGLARMEAITLLEAFVAQVESFELAGEIVRGRNPIVRGLDSVPLRATPVEK